VTASSSGESATNYGSWVGVHFEADRELTIPEEMASWLMMAA